MLSSVFANIANKFPKRYRESPPIPEEVWQNPLYFFAFGFGSGAMPFAKGTFGTLLAIPFYLMLKPLPLGYYLSFVIIFIILSALASDIVSRKIREHDHPGMCIDEFAGFFVTMIAAPPAPVWILIGFLLFRFFDIIKPWPIKFIDENVGGGFGMVLDDVVAGIFSCLIIQILKHLL